MIRQALLMPVRLARVAEVGDGVGGDEEITMAERVHQEDGETEWTMRVTAAQVCYSSVCFCPAFA